MKRILSLLKNWIGVNDDRKTVESIMEEVDRGWRSSFQSEWRKFIHLSNDPVFILDEKYYLVEVNEAGQRLFPEGMRLSAKMHLLDLFQDSEMKEGIVKALMKADERRGVIIRHRCDRWRFAIFTPDRTETGVAYTVLCTRTSSSGGDRRIHV